MAVNYQNVGGQQFQGPDATKANRRLAEALVQQGMNPGKMSHWSEALGSVMQTGVGALKNDFANADERDGRASGNRALAEMLAGGDGSAAMSNPYSADQALQIKVGDHNAARSEAAADRRRQQEIASPEYKLDLEHKQAQIDSLRRKENDPVEQYLLQRLQRPMGQPQQQGGVQPQSNDGMTVPQTGLINIADQQQPAPEAMPQPQQDMVDTPYGRMSTEEARQLGGTMLLSPKYAPAGRAMLDSLGADKGGLAKPTVNTLEERTLNAASQLGRLSEIRKRYNPQFQEIPKRLQMLGLSWSSKLGSQLGGKLNPAQTKELRDYASFRATSVNNLNTILKELSGAAVTPQEYERIKSEQPTAGTGLFDGDDPVSFESKMGTSEQLTRSAIARYNYMRAQGLNFSKDNIDQFLSLDDVPATIEQRGSQIEQKIRQQNPQIQPQALEEMTTRQLKKEFGI